MGRHGSVDMGGSSRIINLADPVSGREPALARNVVNRTPLLAGRIISNALSQSAPGVISLQANTCRLFPIDVLQDCTISSMLLDITIGAAGGVGRLATYACDGSGYPTRLIFDGNQDLDLTAVAVRASSLGGSRELRAESYLIALKTNSIATVRAVLPASISPLLGRLTTAGFVPICGYNVPFTFVANTPFPATFPTGLARSNQGNTNQPLILLVHS